MTVTIHDDRHVCKTPVFNTMKSCNNEEHYGCRVCLNCGTQYHVIKMQGIARDKSV